MQAQPPCLEIYGAPMTSLPVLDPSRFLADGFDLSAQLARFLNLSLEQLAERLPTSTDDLAAIHPGAFDPNQAGAFYEDTVDRKSTRLNSSHEWISRMPSSA